MSKTTGFLTMLILFLVTGSSLNAQAYKSESTLPSDKPEGKEVIANLNTLGRKGVENVVIVYKNTL